MRIKPMKVVTSISLGEEDFKCLVMGGILEVFDPINKKSIHIALEDIGYGAMTDAIADASLGKGIRLGYVRELGREIK